MIDTGMRRGNSGNGRDLGSRPRMASEGSAETSGGGRRVGATYIWTVALRPGELGVVTGATYRVNQRQMVTYGAAVGFRFGGGARGRSRKWL